mgnify:CR=1 FL=1
MNLKQTCNATIQQHIDRMHFLCDADKIKEAQSVYDEIRDWVVEKENLSILSLGYINEIVLDNDF